MSTRSETRLIARRTFLAGTVAGFAGTAWPVRARFAEPARLDALIEQAVDRFAERG